MTIRFTALAVAAVVGAASLALGAGAALASPPQHDTIFAQGEPGSPAGNGCPSSSIRISTLRSVGNSTDPADWFYGKAAGADSNGNDYVCAIALPDSAREAHVGSAFDGIAFYEFVDDNGPGAAAPAGE